MAKKPVRCIIRLPLEPCYQYLLKFAEDRKAGGAGKREATRGAVLTEIVQRRLEAMGDPGSYRLSNKAELYTMERDRSAGKKASPQMTLYLTEEQGSALEGIMAATGRWKSEIITGLFVDELDERGLL